MICTRLDEQTVQGLVPGQYLVLLSRDPMGSVAGRRLGLEIRDTILIFSLEGPSFAFLMRKELEGTVTENVLRYGQGALNIDGCRIPHVTVGDGNLAVNPHLRSHINGGNGGHIIATEPNRRVGIPAVLGRWPTNLVLIHGPECRQSGTHKIRGNRTDTRPQGDGGRDSKEHWRIRPTEATRRGYSDEDGTEAVAVWDCQEGCPVQALDRQSGLLTSGAVAPHYMKNSTQLENQGGYSGGFGDWPLMGYGDSGGASRFFPQFSGQAELLGWFERLLGMSV